MERNATDQDVRENSSEPIRPVYLINEYNYYANTVR